MHAASEAPPAKAHPKSASRPARSRQLGFTVAELLVALLILILVLVGVLALFDLNSRLARAQTQVADMQQSLRIAQYEMVRASRMAGRGGMPRGTLPVVLPPDRNQTGLAVAVRNDVPEDGTIAEGDATSPKVVPGTDVLIIRGVFATPIYQINPAAGDFSLNDPAAPTAGSLVVRDPSPTGVPQDLQPLIDAIEDGEQEALILVSPVDDGIYAVVELNPSGPNTDTSNPDAVGLDFNVAGGTHTADYLALSSTPGTYPTALSTVAFVGILEEHRYYIREEFEVPGDPASTATPALSLARFFPGSEAPYPDAGNLQIDVADNVLDMQAALGFDTDYDEAIFEDGSANDEWLFNHADDDPNDSDKWNGAVGAAQPRLYYVRITTLARTDRPDPGYLTPPITAIEDHAHGETDPPATDAERDARRFRRRLLQTVVDLRNLS